MVYNIKTTMVSLNLMKILIFTIITTILTYSCKPKCEIAYDFEIPASLTSVNDTVNVGDTLWIEFNFSDLVKETTLNEDIYVGNDILSWNKDIRANFMKSTDITLAPGRQGDGVYSFDMINEIGEIEIKSGRITSLNFDYYDNNYHLKTAIIPKEVGVFFIGFGIDMSSIRYDVNKININYKEDCEEYINTLTINLNKDMNGNYNNNGIVFSDNSSSMPGYTPKSTYSFVVK